MKTDHSPASIWHSYAAADKTTKLLAGKAEPLAPGPLDDVARADESPDTSMLEVVEYHQ